MSKTLFSKISLGMAWTDSSDLWVILNPGENLWTDQIDPSLNLLLRRTLLRLEGKPVGEPILIAAPAGHPAPMVLVLQNYSGNAATSAEQWLPQVHKIAAGLTAQTITVFAPKDWSPPSTKAVERLVFSRPGGVSVSPGEFRWVE